MAGGARPLIVLVAALLMAGCVAPAATHAASTSPPPAAPLPTALAWHKLAPMPLPRAEHAAVVVAGKIYAIGGYSFSNNVDGVALGVAPTQAPLRTVDVYDIKNDSWSAGPEYPVPLDHEAAAVVGSTIYVFFGADSYKLDVTAAGAKWTRIAEPPLHAMGAGADVKNGTVYVAGWGAQGRGGGLARYDPARDSYETLAPYPTPRNHAATAFVAGKYYVGNGDVNGHAENTARTVAYDPATNAWADVAPNPVPRGSAAGVDRLGRFVELGGQNQSTGTPVDGLGMGGTFGQPAFPDVHAFDPTTGAWERLPSMPHGRHGFEAVVWDDAIYAVGGAPQQGVSGFDDLSVLR